MKITEHKFRHSITIPQFLRKFVAASTLLALVCAVGAGGAYLGVRNPDQLKWIKNLITAYVVDGVLKGGFISFADLRSLPAINLDIKFKNLEQLERLRQAVVEKKLGPLNPRHKGIWVSAVIDKRAKSIPVKVRLKGQGQQHYRWPRFSLLVKTKKKRAFMGMSRFAIQEPRVSGRHHFDMLFNEALKDHGLLVAGLALGRYYRNGTDLGLVMIEELPTKHLLERQGRRNGPVFRFDDNSLFSASLAFPENIDKYQHFEQFRFYPLFEKSLMKKPATATLVKTGKAMMRDYLLGRIAAIDIFDVKKWAKFVVLSDIWGATHGLGWSNIRLYLNPITLKFEPIAWNSITQIGSLKNAHTSINIRMIGGLDSLVFRMFQSSAMRRAYFEAARELLPAVTTDEFKNRLIIKDRKLRMYMSYFPSQWHHFPSPIDVTELQSKAAAILGLKKSQIVNSNSPVRNDLYRKQNPDLTIVKKTITGGFLRAGNTISMYMKNVLPLPLQIASLRAVSPGDHKLIGTLAVDFPIRIPPYKTSKTADLTIDTSLSWSTPEHEASETEFIITGTAYAENHSGPFTFALRPSTRSRAAFPFHSVASNDLIKAFDFLTLSADGRTISVLPGDWVLDQRLVLGHGTAFKMTPGTTLKFGENASLVVQGRAEIIGTEDQPVRLIPKGDKKWGGLSIFARGARVEISHALISGIQKPNFALDLLTGAITINNANFQFSNSIIENINAEDALNIVRSKYALSNIKIRDVTSDGIDIDGGAGVAKQLEVSRSGGDGLDVSATVISARGLKFQRIHDKAISVGEKSEAQISSVTFEDVGTGIASKDLSTTVADGVELANIRRTPFMAYRKKAEFGPGSLTVNNISGVHPGQLGVVQSGSSLILEGEKISATSVNVDALYNTGPMRKN
jgi:hypothetical protein